MSATESHGGKPMKSAYELALERMENDGIDRPREQAFSADVLEAMAEARTRADAKLAELDILHKKKMRELVDREAAHEQERNYRAERQRIESRRDSAVEKLRAESGAKPGPRAEETLP